MSRPEPIAQPLTTISKLTMAVRNGEGISLSATEANAVMRAVDVLQRVASNDCTNAEREADTILKELDGRWP